MEIGQIALLVLTVLVLHLLLVVPAWKFISKFILIVEAKKRLEL